MLAFVQGCRRSQTCQGKITYGGVDPRLAKGAPSRHDNDAKMLGDASNGFQQGCLPTSSHLLMGYRVFFKGSSFDLAHVAVTSTRAPKGRKISPMFPATNPWNLLTSKQDEPVRIIPWLLVLGNTVITYPRVGVTISFLSPHTPTTMGRTNQQPSSRQFRPPEGVAEKFSPQCNPCEVVRLSFRRGKTSSMQYICRDGISTGWPCASPRFGLPQAAHRSGSTVRSLASFASVPAPSFYAYCLLTSRQAFWFSK